jgi:hypothetical protein
MIVMVIILIAPLTETSALAEVSRLVASVRG